ncbi:hypothetical protein [uncultured Aquimarina sp.]|uniref:hypothetical protein n=1 Tax=uncultured Aquimarina sp. TaxID=575652 RepID=UPI0026147EF6|nr:hypothetical protein [uncultured Aquimarina sp.]
MKKVIFILVCSLFVYSSFAQDMAKVEPVQFRINFLAPGAEVEFGVTKSSTILLNAGFLWGIGSSEDFNGNVETNFAILPIIDGQYRYYYNLKQRQEKGKNISKNSGNFIALKGTYYFTESFLENLEGNEEDLFTDESDLSVIGLAYGIQRTYFDWLHIGFEGGIGYGQTRTDNVVLPILSFTIGYAF